MKVVVNQNGLGLKYAMPYVRHERDIVKLAIKQNAQAVFFASPICLTHPDDKKGDGDIDPEMLAFIDEVHIAPYPISSLCADDHTHT